jgi:hypothetical protein
MIVSDLDSWDLKHSPSLHVEVATTTLVIFDSKYIRLLYHLILFDMQVSVHGLSSLLIAFRSAQPVGNSLTGIAV